jgi:broad specificity phosphatase PhoE
MARQSDPNGEFDRAFSAWAQRPPGVPPEEGARRVREAIAQARRPAPIRAVLAVAAAAVLALAAWLALRPAPPRVQQQAQLDPPIVLEEDVVVWWLDPETPVYFSLPQARWDEGGVS